MKPSDPLLLASDETPSSIDSQDFKGYTKFDYVNIPINQTTFLFHMVHINQAKLVSRHSVSVS